MDGLWMRGPREVVNLYHSFESEGHKIIYAAEIMCDTNACRSLRAKNSEVANRTGARMKYINGGGVIGRREEMLTLYRKAADVMTSRPHLDDQAAVAVIHAQEPSILTLDSESRFFGTIPAMHDLFWRTFQFKNVGLVRKLEKTINRSFLPAYIHFPGMRMRLGHTSNPCQLFLGGVYNHVIDGLLRKTELKRRRRVNPARLELKGQPEDLLLPRIVVSLTTTRFRLSHLLPTLLSLLHQTLPPDAVVLNLGYDVTQLPSWLNHSLNGQIVVRWVKDEGPITKLLPTLRAESDPNTLIITADDDMIYQRRHIELLCALVILSPKEHTIN
ncbi:hypothetical protein AB1Y20_001750 [Prymnesium parvum]|uniref:Uncharacterized protein n=1 Tax=Prymnesium parvum TaxID=97485 RepID=A0AB34K975_PRYPA